MKPNYNLNKTGFNFDHSQVYSALNLARYGTPYQPKNPDQKYYKNILMKYMAERYQDSQSDGKDGFGIGDIFQNRKELIQSKIELLLLQMTQRKQINQQVLRQIDMDKCYAQNLIFSMGLKQYEMGQERLALERMKMDLEKQRRLEHVSYFRDTGLLRRDLTNSLIDYLEESQNGHLIAGMEVEQ